MQPFPWKNAAHKAVALAKGGEVPILKNFHGKGSG